jgi:hypothetical protein
MNGSAADEGFVLCSSDKNSNLYCSSKGICECPSSPVYSQVIYDEELSSCVPVPGPEDDFRCQSDSQCKASGYGRYSKCNRDDGRCSCYHPTHKVSLVNNICYTMDASRRMADESFPECSDGRICQMSSLGNLTRCNEAEGRCECYDTVSNGKNDVGFYEGRCYVKKKLGEFCSTVEECRVGYHKNAVCVGSPAYLPGEKVCSCPNGEESCDGGSGSGVVNVKNAFIVGITTVLMKGIVDNVLL